MNFRWRLTSASPFTNKLSMSRSTRRGLGYFGEGSFTATAIGSMSASCCWETLEIRAKRCCVTLEITFQKRAGRSSFVTTRADHNRVQDYLWMLRWALLPFILCQSQSGAKALRLYWYGCQSWAQVGQSLTSSPAGVLTTHFHKVSCHSETN